MGLWDDTGVLAEAPRVARQKRQLARPVFTRPTDWKPHDDLPELHGLVALDLETKDRGLAQGKGSWWFRHDGGFICGVGIGSEATGDFYLPVRHSEGNIDPDRVFRWLRAQAKKPDVTFVYANAPYDIGWLSREGIEVSQLPHDVQVQAALIDEFQLDNSLNALGLKNLGEGKNDAAFKEACRAGGLIDPFSNMDLVPAWLAETYGLQDISLTRRLFPLLAREIAEQQLDDVYQLERECCLVAVDLKARGVAIDNGQVERVRRDFVGKRQEYLHLVQEQTGVHVSPSDPKSIIKALRAENPNLQLPKTADGHESIREEVLDKLPDSKAVTAIRWARKYDRAISTFIDSYLIGNQYRGRIHCDFNPTRRGGDETANGGATSGRFSSSNPNLQNIPIRIPQIALPIRSCFVPDHPEHDWAKFDYKSQEPRLTIHYAYLLELKGAAEMVERFRRDPLLDLHYITALLMFRHTPESWQQLTKHERFILRDRAKRINLAIPYGAGGAAIARDHLKLPTMRKTIIGRNNQPVTIEVAGPEAQALLYKHHAGVPWMKELQQIAKARVEERGYVTTLMGRRVRFRRYGDEYSRTHKGLNACVQGSAADQMKRALVMLRRAGIPMLLTIHDETDASIPRGDSAYIRRIQDIMEAAMTLSMPVIAEVKIGADWGAVSVD